jgi:hypothetical protein
MWDASPDLLWCRRIGARDEYDIIAAWIEFSHGSAQARVYERLLGHGVRPRDARGHGTMRSFSLPIQKPPKRLEPSPATYSVTEPQYPRRTG